MREPIYYDFSDLKPDPVSLGVAALGDDGQFLLNADPGCWLVDVQAQTREYLTLSDEGYRFRARSREGSWLGGHRREERGGCSGVVTPFRMPRGGVPEKAMDSEPYARHFYALDESGSAVGFGNPFYDFGQCTHSGGGLALAWRTALESVGSGRLMSVNDDGLAVGFVEWRAVTVDLSEKRTDLVPVELNRPEGFTRSFAFHVSQDGGYVAGTIGRWSGADWVYYPCYWQGLECHRIFREGKEVAGALLGMNSDGLGCGVILDRATANWDRYEPRAKPWNKEEPCEAYVVEKGNTELKLLSGWLGPRFQTASWVNELNQIVGYYENPTQPGGFGVYSVAF